MHGVKAGWLRCSSTAAPRQTAGGGAGDGASAVTPIMSAETAAAVNPTRSALYAESLAATSDAKGLHRLLESKCLGFASYFGFF